MLFLVRYHARSNEQVLDTSAKLTDQELRRDPALDHGSAYETLLHLHLVDWSWRDFCVTNDADDDSYPEGWPPEDLASIRAFASQEDSRLIDFVRSLDDEALDQRLTWTVDGSRVSFPRWAVLLHLVNHGTQHRSELARYLTECGHSPGDLDLL
jgi:uncharacterized damage-inducible protein DinB